MTYIFENIPDYRTPMRLASDLRKNAAKKANSWCLDLIDHIITKKYPTRKTMTPDEVDKKIEMLYNSLSEELEFLFDITQFYNLPENPVRSIYNAFSSIVECNNIRIHDNKVIIDWEENHLAYLQHYELYKLFNEKNKKAAIKQAYKGRKRRECPAIRAEMLSFFYIAYEILQRVNTIKNKQESPISTCIMEIMPYDIQVSLVGSSDINFIMPEKNPNTLDIYDPTKDQKYNNPRLYHLEGFIIYRKDIARELELTPRTLHSYEKRGLTSASTYWPPLLKYKKGSSSAFYDPQKLIEAITQLPQIFNGVNTEVILNKILSGLLSKKAPKDYLIMIKQANNNEM